MAFLPDAACLMDARVKALEDWVKSGGTLVIFGETATKDENGRPRSRSDPSWEPAPGTHALGNGRFVAFASDIGAAYRRTPTDALRVQFTASLAGSPATGFPGPANVVVQEDTALAGRALLFHLANGDCDIAADTVRDSSAFQFDAALPSSLQGDPTLQGYLISPDRKAPQLAHMTLGPRKLSIRCPSAHIWDMMVVMPEVDARIFAAGPIADLQDAIELASGYDLSKVNVLLGEIASATRGGNHLLARELALQALDDVRLIARQRVFFDEAHNERNTLSAERAAAIQPDPPS
jgi:hypothetical protein